MNQREALELGISCIPCGQDKTPYFSWKRYQTAYPTLQDIENWEKKYNPASWAAVTGTLSSLLILDFDGDKGLETMQDLKLAPHVRTPHGAHVWVSYPGQPVKTLNGKSKAELGRLYPGLDIRADGGYAIFTGSNRDGGYNWVGTAGPLSWESLPESLRSYLLRENEPVHKSTAESTRNQAIMDRMMDNALQSAPKGRNDAMLGLACQLRDNGFSEDTAIKHCRDFISRAGDYDAHGRYSPVNDNEIIRTVQSAYGRSPRKPWESRQKTGTSGFSCTDLGNAERFVALHGENVRYVADWKQWLIWDETRWCPDETLEIDQLAKLTVRNIYKEAMDEKDGGHRKYLAAWAAKSESAPRIQNMLTLARSELAMTSDKLDTDQYLLCVLNGVLDLRNGELLQPKRDNYITRQTPIEYDRSARCPRWIEFLERVQPDQEARDYLQRCIGYSLSGDVSEHCIFFLYGEGRNGKSVTVETLRSLVGKEYFKKVDAELLMYKPSRNAGETKADLIGKRVVSTTEISEGQRLNEGLIKDLAGGDEQDARRLYCQSRDFKVRFHIWLYGNHKPAIKGKDTGIWSRIRLIPFPVIIPVEERDKHLNDKLHMELSGILNWAVKGFLMWQKHGLHEPEVVLNATNEYRYEQDGLQEFLSECCVISRQAVVSKKALWEAYQAWIQETGDEGYDSQRYFNDDIRRRPGIKEIRLTAGAKAWRGIGLIDSRVHNEESLGISDPSDPSDQVSVTFL